jgi:Uma2 family endonuclease
MFASAAALIVEVADSTLRHDLQRKEPRYRAAGLPELWIAGADGPTLWVRRSPAEEGWRFQQAFGADESASPACAPDAAFAVNSLAERA